MQTTKIDLWSQQQEQLDLSDYLNGEDLHKSLNISKSQQLSFHWADWVDTCKWQALQFQKDTFTSKGREALNEKIRELQNIQTWVDRNGERTRISLFEMYRLYIHPGIRMALFENVQSRFLISQQGAQGPYLDARSLRWFKKEEYLNFVYHELLQGRLPFRKFRLRTKIPMEFSFQEGGTIHTLILEARQVSAEGIFWYIPRSLLARLLEINQGTVVVNLENLIQEFTHFHDSPWSGKGNHHYQLDLFTCLAENNGIYNAQEWNRQEFFLFTRFDLLKPTHLFVGGDDLPGELLLVILSIFSLENTLQKQMKKLEGDSPS